MLFPTSIVVSYRSILAARAILQFCSETNKTPLFPFSNVIRNLLFVPVYSGQMDFSRIDLKPFNNIHPCKLTPKLYTVLLQYLMTYNNLLTNDRILVQFVSLSQYLKYVTPDMQLQIAEAIENYERTNYN